MKSLLKLAVGAAIAGALVELLTKQRGERRSHQPGHDAAVQAGASPPTALVADESSVGEGSGDDRVQLPEDGRVRTPS